MARAPKDRTSADLAKQLEECGEELARALRARELAESRGRRWLEDLCLIDDQINLIMKHIEAEVRAKRAKAVHHYLYERLTSAREAMAAPSSGS